MRVTVRGKNIGVTNALKEYVEKRLGKLEKFLEDIDDVQVTLTVENNTHRVEVTIPLNGIILRGEEETADMYASIDLVIEKLSKQIDKYKTRLNRKGPSLDKLASSPGEGFKANEFEEERSMLVKTKRFAIKPMDAEEAIMQMNLIGHSFFVFSNSETNQVNVVYRRKDGKYGLIEPEF